METIKARGKFHAAHRQLDYDGKCAYVHGHTWRGVFVVRTERFPRLEKLDMSVDFGSLKDIFKFLDHKMLVSSRDTTFLDAKLFDSQGIVVLPGENPSVENVAEYCLDQAAEDITRSCSHSAAISTTSKFPSKRLTTISSSPTAICVAEHLGAELWCRKK